jgi:hypothetical protein
MSVSKKSGRIILAVVFSVAVTIAVVLSVIIRRDKPPQPTEPAAVVMPGPVEGLDETPSVALQSVSIESTNTVPGLGMTGDTVSLRFIVGESENVSPSVEMAGRPAVVRRDGETYTAELKLASDDVEGKIAFSITLRDSDGNSIGRSDHTTDGSWVLHDRTAPTLEVVSLQADNPYNPQVATKGSRITVSIAATEPLGGPPKLWVAGNLVDGILQVGPTRFTAELDLPNEMTEGPVPYRIEYGDVVGNRGTAVTQIDGTTELIYDSKAPIIRSVGIASTNRQSKFIALPGDTVVIVFTVDEELSEQPSVRIAGVRASNVTQIAPKTYEARGVSPRDLPEEAIGFSIYVEDEVGIAASIVNRTTDGSAIMYWAGGPDYAWIDTVDMAAIDEVAAAETAVGAAPEAVAAVDQVADDAAADDDVAVDVAPGAEAVADEVADEVATVDDRAPGGAAAEDEVAVDAAAGAAAVVATAAVARPGFGREINIEEEISDTDTMDIDIKVQVTIVRTTPREEEPSPVEIESEKPVQETRVAEEPEISEPVPLAAEPEAAEAAATETVMIAIRSEEEEARPDYGLTGEAVSPARQVVIDSPGNGSLYGSHVEVTGRVYQPEKVVSVGYEVSPLVFLGQRSAFLAGYGEISADGVFTLIFSTEEISGSQQVTITVAYEDGKRHEAELALHEGESDVPSFAVQAQGENVLLTWDRHPLAKTYSVTFRNTSNGVRGAVELIDPVASPTRISGLTIGNAYQFALRAHDANGDSVGDSGRIEMIALTEDTLTPTVKGEYKRIKVSWPEIAATDNFFLERAIEGKTDFSSVGGPINNTVYYDTDVRYGATYFYRVRPEKGTLHSGSATGESLAFPEERTRVAATWQDIAVSDAEVFGNYAFLAGEEGGMVIFDISNADKPVAVSSADTSFARGVAILDGYAYVADGERGLKVIDIDNPLRPVEVGSRKTSDAQAVMVVKTGAESRIAVVADGTYGVKLIDVSNPKDPERRLTIPTENAQDIELMTQGGRDYAVVADGEGGVLIIDIATSDTISSIATADARGIAVAANLLYVADIVQGLVIVDIGQADAPVIISEHAVAYALDVAVSDDFAYIASETEGLLIFDVKSSRLPSFYDEVKIEGVRWVAVKGSKIFAGGDAGFHLLDTFARGESYEIASVQTDGKAYEVAIHTEADSRVLAYVADRAGGLKIFDVTNPDSLNGTPAVSHVPTEYCREAVAVGDYVYIADGPGGIKIADISALRREGVGAEVPIIGSWNTDGNARSLSYANGLLYVADGNRGIKVIDVNSPTRPTEIALARTEYATNIRVSDGYVYLADGDGGFKIYDADPTSLELVSVTDTANTRGVDIQDGVAYVVGSEGLFILDVSTPSEPRRLGVYRTGYAEEVTVEGRLAFVAEGFNGLTIVDIAKPSDPYVVSRNRNKYAVGVAVAGKYAYLVDTAGLKIVEILIPTWAMRD